METSIPSIQLYTSTSLDQSAYLQALGFIVEILKGEGKCALFAFEDSPELRDAICEFNQGGFARRLLTSRSRLYREASEIMKLQPIVIKRGVSNDR
jgi:hypothetical protein